MLTMFPDQAVALMDLFKLPRAVVLDVAPADHMSLRAAVYFRPDESDQDAPPAAARWFTISVAGTTREIAPDPEPVAS